MSAVSVIDLYDRLANAPDDRTRAKVIAEAFEMLEARYPHLTDLATRQHLSETELRLKKEIEQVRLQGEQVRSELKETELKLTKEIEQVRLQGEQMRLELAKEIEQVRSELKETELRLQKEIEQVRLQVEQVRSELANEIEQVRLTLTKEIEQSRTQTERVRASLVTWSFVFWGTQFAAIMSLLWRMWPTAG